MDVFSACLPRAVSYVHNIKLPQRFVEVWAEKTGDILRRDLTKFLYYLYRAAPMHTNLLANYHVYTNITGRFNT